MREFINNLNISQEDKIKLNALGVENEFALLGMINAVPKEIDEYIGSDTVLKIQQDLVPKLTPEQKKILESPLPHYKIQF